jgi:hypothetical protein
MGRLALQYAQTGFTRSPRILHVSFVVECWARKWIVYEHLSRREDRYSRKQLTLDLLIPTHATSHTVVGRVTPATQLPVVFNYNSSRTSTSIAVIAVQFSSLVEGVWNVMS